MKYATSLPAKSGPGHRWFYSSADTAVFDNTIPDGARIGMLVGDLVHIKDTATDISEKYRVSAVDATTGVASLSSSEDSSRKLSFNRVRHSNIEVLGIGASGQVGMQTTPAEFTWQQIVSTRARAFAARVTYYNLSANAFTVGKTTLTPSSTYLGDGANFDPTGGVAPVNVTFAGAAAAIVPAGTAAAHASIQSDWVTIRALDRADLEKAFHLWHLRSYIAAGVAVPYHTISNYSASPDNSVSGKIWMAGHQAGDLVATPTGYTSNSGLALGVNVEFKGLSRTIRIASLGDSITGSNTFYSRVGSFSNMVDQAIAKINPKSLSSGTFFSHINCGVTSQSMPQFYARLPGIISNHNPDIVVMATWSPNVSITTQAEVNAVNRLVSDGIDAVLSSGAIPILCTGMPKNVQSAAMDSIRLANNAMWRKIADENSYVVCDWASVTDGPVINGVTQFAAGVGEGGVHPDPAGQAKVADLLASILLRIQRT